MAPPEGTRDPPSHPGGDMGPPWSFAGGGGNGGPPEGDTHTWAGFSHFLRKSSFARAKNSFTGWRTHTQGGVSAPAPP